MIRQFGEAALLVDLPGSVEVHALAAALGSVPGVTLTVPGMVSLLVELDPLTVDPAALAREIEGRLDGLTSAVVTGRERIIPVCYGGEMGPDLAEVAELTGLTADDVIRRHSASQLTVQIVGFAPGFAYLGDMPAELAVPRLETPRTSTPPGSVAIAGRQTGIYPASLPGGWRVIGRTPVALFDARRDPPAYLAPGDRVRFVAIPADEWERHAGPAEDW